MKTVNTHYAKMTVSERAKQFMPFAALKGYEEALRKKEIEVEEAMKGKVQREKADKTLQNTDLDI